MEEEEEEGPPRRIARSESTTRPPTRSSIRRPSASAASRGLASTLFWTIASSELWSQSIDSAAAASAAPPVVADDSAAAAFVVVVSDDGGGACSVLKKKALSCANITRRTAMRAWDSAPRAPSASSSAAVGRGLFLSRKSSSSSRRRLESSLRPSSLRAAEGSRVGAFAALLRIVEDTALSFFVAEVLLVVSLPVVAAVLLLSPLPHVRLLSCKRRSINRCRRRRTAAGTVARATAPNSPQRVFTKMSVMRDVRVSTTAGAFVSNRSSNRTTTKERGVAVCADEEGPQPKTDASSPSSSLLIIFEAAGSEEEEKEASLAKGSARSGTVAAAHSCGRRVATIASTSKLLCSAPRTLSKPAPNPIVVSPLCATSWCERAAA